MKHIRMSKFQSEQIPVTVNMLDRCGDGEYLTDATTTCTVSSGEDPTPSTILDGTPDVINQAEVQQVVVGGVTGVIYQLQFAAETNLGSIYIDTVHLAILPDALP